MTLCCCCSRAGLAACLSAHVTEQPEMLSHDHCARVEHTMVVSCCFHVRSWLRHHVQTAGSPLTSTVTFAGGQTNPEHLRQIYQAHLMLQLRVQEVGEYNQPEAIMTAARAVCRLFPQQQSFMYLSWCTLARKCAMHRCGQQCHLQQCVSCASSL